MAKLQIKSKTIATFGGIFKIMELFERLGLGKLVDSSLGKSDASWNAHPYYGQGKADYRHRHQEFPCRLRVFLQGNHRSRRATMRAFLYQSQQLLFNPNRSIESSGYVILNTSPSS